MILGTPGAPWSPVQSPPQLLPAAPLCPSHPIQGLWARGADGSLCQLTARVMVEEEPVALNGRSGENEQHSGLCSRVVWLAVLSSPGGGSRETSGWGFRGRDSILVTLGSRARSTCSANVSLAPRIAGEGDCR